MKKHLLIVLALIVMVLSFSSCGQENEHGNGHEHAWGEWTVTTEATCTADGEQTRTCECGETEKKAIPAKGTGHVFVEWVTTTPVTKTENGLKEQTCTVCGEVHTEVIPALGSEGLEFKQNSDGTFRVSGIGGCKDTDIVIPAVYNGEPVTSIGDYAFSGCSSLTSIVIPDSVTSIGKYAFSDCHSLTSIVIPDSVTSIGDEAFRGCSSLTEISVHENNMYYCSENGILFNKDKTKLICYPAGKTETSYFISDSVTSIDNGAFAHCSSLTSIVIPDSVTSIGEYAFYGCSSLTSVVIPDGMTSIGYEAFRDCSSLTSIQFGGTIAQWKAISFGSSWNSFTGDYIVTCTDGTVAKDGTVTYN